MTRTSGCRLVCRSLFSALLLLSAPLTRAQWTQPTPEELSMTSQPQVPGAAAVYLYREESTEDNLHMFSVYVRLKVLTDLGKEFGNVELDYAHFSGGANLTIDSIQGRTIHPDGTIVPFTGKPYDKLVEKAGGVKIMAKVFSMPDVEPGSIIEYRYKLRYDDDYYIPPDWYIQSKLFTRKAHYSWRPTNKPLMSGGDHAQLTASISWTPILPAGTELKQSRFPGTDALFFELDVHDILPAPEEDFMPPVASLSYRVLFYYSAYRTGEEYWKNEGNTVQATRQIHRPGSAVTAAVHDLIAPADTQDQKLRKIYAAVMQLENTDFTREHSSAEEKAEGFKDVHNTDDIWKRKRGATTSWRSSSSQWHALPA